ncbi:hypothetical protein [Mucilaginibacter dorajii]|uniref:Integral membrane protein n=1 Tax=Mucilaginibacter dorajii TaxID=692994 RepID=A0ABP7PIR9_9SPHI|nr:hypothetical protein [Mucilaginibacter dorajii]MCS3733467.1 hypothetical protein [Mucilaginibacter dorajii]
MILTQQELSWIDERMKTYQIKYGEIYNEILDHIISAIESEREAGDRNSIEFLFQQVVDGQFGGYEGIANLAAKQEYLYTQQIQDLWWQSLRYHITWPMLGFTVIALLLSLELPNVESVKWLLMAGCLLLTGSSVIYAYFSLKGRVVKSVDSSQSFLRRHLIKKISTSFWLLNWLLCFLPGYAINYLSPTIFVAVTMLYIFLNLSAIRFCQHFKALIPITS